MPKAQSSVYQRTKEFLSAHPGQYFASEAVMDALGSKDANTRKMISRSLPALVQIKASGIKRRRNDQGRYEYFFPGEAKSASKPPEGPVTKPAAKKRLRTLPQAQTRSLKKLANFIRAYLELSAAERREAYGWLKEQVD